MSDLSDRLLYYDSDNENPEYYDDGIFHLVTIGDVFNDKYKITYKLGFGRYSIVWLVNLINTDIYYALKISSSDGVDDMQNEIDSLNLFDKNRIIDIFDFISNKGTYLCLVLPVYGSSLYYINKQLPYKIVDGIVKSILNQLKSMHDKNYIHGDIKDCNILIRKKTNLTNDIISGKFKTDSIFVDKKIDIDLYTDDDLIDVVLIDYGYSFSMDDDMPYDPQPFDYQAPEVTLKMKYDQTIDIWSVGCIAYRLLTGEELMIDNDIEDISDIEYRMCYLFELFKSLPNEYYDSINMKNITNVDKTFINLEPSTEDNLYNKLRDTNVNELELSFKMLSSLLNLVPNKRKYSY